MEHTDTSDTFSGMSSTTSATDSVSNNQPIQLLTPISLATGTVHSISSATPFYFNGVKVWCATPLHIYRDSGKSKPLNIEPSQDLSQDFVRGWNKLPDELKLNVLRFNLVHKEPINYYTAFNEDAGSATSYGSHLRSTPEIATLSQTVYYSMNTFKLLEGCFSRSDSSDDALFFAYPNPSVNSLIQSLEVHYQVFMPNDSLVQLAKGRYGFQSLRSLRITMEYKERWSENGVRFFLDRIREPYRFGCKGLLEFVAPTSGKIEGDWQEQGEAFVERLKPWFIFGCSKTKRGIVAEVEDDEVGITN